MPLTLQFEHIEYAQSISVSPMPESGSDVTTGTNRVITYGDDESIESVLVQIDKTTDTSASDKSLFVTPKLQYSTADSLTNTVNFQKSNTGIRFSFNADGYTRTATFELLLIPKRSKMIFGGGLEMSSSGNIQIPKVDGTDDIPSISCGTYKSPGLYGIAVGEDTISAGKGSQAFGYKTQAFGEYSHAEGSESVAVGIHSHAEGCSTKALGNYSHAEGQTTVASFGYAHAEGYATTAGYASHAEGYRTKATGDVSHAEGDSSVASGELSHAEGYRSTASGQYSHAEGTNSEASGDYSHAGGCYSQASGDCSYAFGYEAIAMGTFAYSLGRGTIAYDSQHVIGSYNMPAQNSEIFVIGNGTSDGRDADCSTALYVSKYGNLNVSGSVNAYSADYAEFFEWKDGNPQSEDRVGHFVTMDGEHIQYANSGDYILGIVSGNPAVVGNDGIGYHWKYERDAFGRIVTEYLETVEEEIDVSNLSDEEIKKLKTDSNVAEKDGKFYRSYSVVSDTETSQCRRKINSDYNVDLPYVERKDRPEWDYVGMLGILPVYDDGTCEVNSYCQCGENGIATKATMAVPGQAFRVIKRVSSNIIKVMFR